jgi:predicted metalloprotease
MIYEARSMLKLHAPALITVLFIALAHSPSDALGHQAATPSAQAYRGSGQESPYTGAFSDLAIAIDTFWSGTFNAVSLPYASPAIVPLGQVVDTACGPHGPGSGALYCTLDSTIYLSPVFLSEVDVNVGDYAPITILAHEWGHHVQFLTNAPDPGGNTFELQADCLAGVYTQNAEDRDLLEPGDITEAVTVSRDSGDPLGLPQDQPGAHGINDDRITAFMNGYLNGLTACNLPLTARPIPEGPEELPLPNALPLVHAACFRVEADGNLTFDELIARFSRSDEAAARLRAWGWQASAFRTFACDRPPEGESGWIDISGHLFADEDAARQAVDYFAAARAEGASLMTGAPPEIGDYAAVLTGPASNGTEFTLYASQGPLLIRVTGVAPSGIPFGNVFAVAQSVLAIQQGGSSAVSAALAPVLASSAYLPAAPDVTHAACFTILGRGTYAFSDVDAAFQQAGMTTTDVAELGWRDGAYVVFRCTNPPDGRAAQIEVVIHQFRDSLAAQQALPYADRTYQPKENEIRDCDAAGPLVICVTGRSPTGSPLSDVAFVLQQVLAAAGQEG